MSTTGGINKRSVLVRLQTPIQDCKVCSPCRNKKPSTESLDRSVQSRILLRCILPSALLPIPGVTLWDVTSRGVTFI